MNTCINVLMKLNIPHDIIPAGLTKAEWIAQLAEKTLLTAINCSTKPINYKVLCMLPSDIPTIKNYIGFNIVSVNNHVNEMESAGLVTRERGTGKVDLTDLSKNILILIEHIQKEVSKNLKEMT